MIGAASFSARTSNARCARRSPITTRTQLIVASIAHFQNLNSGGDPIFGGTVDFSKLGLMGHSRGAEAVIVVPEIITLARVIIKCVISLAPVNNGASSGKPKGYAFPTVLPAMDGDVIDNNGAEFYDQATADPLKSQIYVNHANHNYFNRQWLNDDANGGLPAGLEFESPTAHQKTAEEQRCSLKTLRTLRYQQARLSAFVKERHMECPVRIEKFAGSTSPQRYFWDGVNFRNAVL